MPKTVITTAVALTDKQFKTFSEQLVKQAHVDAKDISAKVDPAVLGGIKVAIGSQELDGTVQSKLRSIHETLQAEI
ncbi:MAG: F0F1 ATP synthase subunit delta [bacterium]|nr:F0F1 ATP synthase subunit delta [bacterium]